MIILHTLFDYLEWRGDIPFKESPLNEVDSLIFCAFSYCDIDSLLAYQEKRTIQDLYTEYQQIQEDSVFKKNQNRLFQMLSESNRFKEVVVTRYFNEVNEEKEIQIAGMAFILPNDTLFVVFKGTDSTLTGWKEDFALSYKMVIPAQEKAVSYLNEILSSTKKEVFVGGHSKGGNLAMYASLFCQNFDKLVRIYNHDGPGFHKEILETKEYQERKEKIITYIPKASIVGNLFNEDTKTMIVKSKQLGFLQHDLYSWLVINNHFVYTKELSEEAKKLSNLLNETIDKLPNATKEKIINVLFEILESWNIQDIEKGIGIFSSSIFQKYNLKVEDLTLLYRLIPIVVEIMKRLL